MAVGVGLRQPLKSDDTADRARGQDKHVRHLDALVQRAVFELKRGELQRARMLAKYLMEAQHSPEGIKIYAIASHLLGDEDAAWATYPTALEHFPRDLNVMVGFAEMCLNRHAFERAAALLKEALALDPEARHPAGAKARVLIMRAQKQ